VLQAGGAVDLVTEEDDETRVLGITDVAKVDEPLALELEILTLGGAGGDVALTHKLEDLALEDAGADKGVRDE
jgi:hypothetical protein